MSSTGKKPFISIIVPVYNAQRYLARCIDSLLGQTLENIEILCVNDGSVDNSLAILKGYEDERLVIIDKKNGGVSDARNSGLDAAGGDYIMFVDSDDWIDVKTCESAYRSIVCEQADVVLWSYVTETPKRSTPKEIFSQNRIFDREQVRETLHRRLIGVVGEELAHPELADSLCPVWGKLYRKEVIEKAGARFVPLKEIGTYEDGLFNLEVFGMVDKAVYLTDCFYHYVREGETSVTSGYRKDLFSQWKNLFHKMQSYIDANHLPDVYKVALSNRIALSILGLGLNVLQSNQSIATKEREIQMLLTDAQYQAACKNLELQYFPLHWKVFYKASARGCAKMVYFLLFVINRMIR